MVLRVFADFVDERIFVRRRQIGFLHVARKNRRLVGQQQKQARDGFFFRREFERERGFAGVRDAARFFPGRFPARALPCRRAWRLWRRFSRRFLHGFQIGEHQFGGDGFDVAHGINAAGDVMDVRVFKAAHDLHDGVHFADVGEKFIAQTFALRRAFDQAGDVHKLNRRRDDDGRFGDVFAAPPAARPAR